MALTGALELLVEHLCDEAVLEAIGRGAAHVGGEVRRGGQHAAQPGQVAVADQLVAGDPERTQARRRLEGATPHGRDVVVR